MKIAALAAIWITLCGATAAAAPVYECMDADGQRTYSQTPGKNCKPARLSPTCSYVVTPPPAAATETPANTAVPAPTATETDPARTAKLQAAQRKLAEAQHKLETGAQVRYGNERNYAKYLERIAGLEAAVRQSERELQQLQQPSSATELR